MDAPSPLQRRLNDHELIVSKRTTDGAQPLIDFVLSLCQQKNYGSAEQLLLLCIESPLFAGYESLAIVWILRAEIAEEVGDLQRSLTLFQDAIKYEPQPLQDIIAAFDSLRSRHRKPMSSSNSTTVVHVDTPMPKPAVSKTKTSVSTAVNMEIEASDGFLSAPSSQYAPLRMPAHAISAVIDAHMPCTPLTDDFEHCMLSTERKNKRRKKYEFRSRPQSRHDQPHQKEKGPTHDTQSQAPPKLPVLSDTRAALSPILDQGESNMSLSTSFVDPPITPHPHAHPIATNETAKNGSKNDSHENSMMMMDMSGVSDISSIDDHTLLLSPTRSPQFSQPKTQSHRTPPSSAPRARRPLSPFLEVPMATKSPANWRLHSQSQVSAISQITQRLDSIEIEDKENTFSFAWQLQPQSKKPKTEESGSRVRMALITVSPSKRSKYGSQKILSPVRRSTRIEQKYGNQTQTKPAGVQLLLQQSNYTFVPNPMLNKTK